MSCIAHAQAGKNNLPDPGKTVKFYPNPATTQITFDLEDSYAPGTSISIFSFLGKKMTEAKAAGQKTNIALTNFNRGVYIFYIRDANGRVIENGKFQVSN
jgi:hypothetical protein